MSVVPVVLVHGYSDQAQSLAVWKSRLLQEGFKDIRLCGYKTLTDEINITDIAEAFDRQLRARAGLEDGQPFDAIVHSTGMLVLRKWLMLDPANRKRLKRLIGLAPATFGSPLAHKGHSEIAVIVKGNKTPGADFLETGKHVLENLELASPYTWHLAHQDLVGEEVVYGQDADTPYVFVFCGDQDYWWPKSMGTDGKGADGTVRWSGCAMNSRKVEIDLTKGNGKERFEVGIWRNLDIPMIPAKGHNHASILGAPSDELVSMVADALKVQSKDAFDAWLADARAKTEPTREGMQQWQQFIVRMVDERGEPVPDYYLAFFTYDGAEEQMLTGLGEDVHAYEADKSFRCFHVNLSKLQPENLKNLWVRVTAITGTALAGYTGHDDTSQGGGALQDPWIGRLCISDKPPAQATGFKLFYPFTTTLLEITINREPGKGLCSID